MPEHIYVQATKVLIKESILVTPPASNLRSTMHGGLLSAVSSLSSSFSTARLSSAAAAASGSTTTNQHSPHHFSAYVKILYPYRISAVSMSLLLMYVLTILGLSIAGYCYSIKRRSQRSGDFHYYNTIKSEISVTHIDFRGKEQSPILSKRISRSFLHGVEQVNPIVVYLANIVHDHTIPASPPGDFTDLLNDSSGLASPSYRVIKSEFPDSPNSGATRTWPILISDSSSPRSSCDETRHSSPRKLSAVVSNSPVYFPSSDNATHLKLEEINSADEADYPNRPIFNPLSNPTTTSGNTNSNSDKENEATCKRESSESTDSLETEERKRWLLHRVKYEDEDETGSLDYNYRHNLLSPAPLAPRASTRPSLSSSTLNESTAESRNQTAVQRWLNAGSPPSGYSGSESQDGISPGELSALLAPHAEQRPRVVLTVNPLRRGAPRAGRKAPERFADSEYSIWRKR